jgi:hypothetical protein
MLHGSRGACFTFSRKEPPWPPEAVRSSKISQEEFLRVSEALYEESLVIQQDIQAENNSDATS